MLNLPSDVRIARAALARLSIRPQLSLIVRWPRASIPIMVMKFVVTLSWLMIPSMASAQAAPPACADSTMFFEFQVTEPARWIGDTALAAHPTPAVRNPANLVAFIVDTAGIPITASFHVLKVTDPTVIAAARASLPAWRFRPAVLGGCRVRQRTQTPVGR